MQGRLLVRVHVRDPLAEFADLRFGHDRCNRRWKLEIGIAAVALVLERNDR